jgi:hypothetical protein
VIQSYHIPIGQVNDYRGDKSRQIATNRDNIEKNVGVALVAAYGWYIFFYLINYFSTILMGGHKGGPYIFNLNAKKIDYNLNIFWHWSGIYSESGRRFLFAGCLLGIRFGYSTPTWVGGNTHQIPICYRCPNRCRISVKWVSIFHQTFIWILPVHILIYVQSHFSNGKRNILTLKKHFNTIHIINY